MAKLYTAAQLQELQRLAANNKPLKSALEKVLSGRTKDLGSAEKKLLQQAVNMSPKDFVSAVESRLGLGSKARSAADLPQASSAANDTAKKAEAKGSQKAKDAKNKAPKPKRATTRSRASSAAKDAAKKAEAKVAQKMKDAKNKAAKKASETASKTAKAAGKTAAKAGEATVKGASKAGSAFGGAKAVGKGLGKVAAPVAAVGEAVNVANLLLNEDARQEARDYVKGMEDDNILMRSGKSFLSPTDTIFGAGSAFVDALSSMEAGQQALYDAGEMRKRLAPQRAAAKAKGDRRESALRDTLDAYQMQDLERAAVRSPELLKEYAAIQTPEQAKALYDSAFGDPEPTADEVVDQNLAAVDGEPAVYKAAEPEPDSAAGPIATVASRVAADAAADAVADAAAPEDYTNEAVDLFKNTHGTEFDPKSSMDKGKLEKMKSMLAKQGGLGDMTPNQFALQVYRNS